MKETVQKTAATDNNALIGDHDRVSVEIWGYQYKKFLRASEIIAGLGGGKDNTAEHLIREFFLQDNVGNIVDLFLDGADMPSERLEAMEEAWYSQRKSLG